jgi:hypothetical protein
MDFVKRVNDKSVKLCCGGRGCPTITDLGNGSYEVKDDNGNIVILKKEELKLVNDAMTTLDSNQQLILG